MSKTQWREGRYGSQCLNLGIVSATVFWGSCRGDQYVAKTSDGTERKQFASADEAKQWAEGRLKKGLVSALSQLKAMHVEEGS